MEKPLISVIVPVYKVQNYLERCVNSIRTQTYSNLEIILVDDGSPDKSGKICDYFAEIDSLVEDIRSMKDEFLEKWIEPCNNVAYDKSLTIEEKIRRIREIIGKSQ